MAGHRAQPERKTKPGEAREWGAPQPGSQMSAQARAEEAAPEMGVGQAPGLTFAFLQPPQLQ